MIGTRLQKAVEQQIFSYRNSQLSTILNDVDPYAIKFVQSRWAKTYESTRRLKVSETPALTWGTATYVTPIAYPLSSALYGRIGLVTDFDPEDWRIFDATTVTGRMAYIAWARAQPVYADLLLTVHSTQANHLLRDQFRENFRIDCVLFHPDQEAESYTDRVHHVWMAVTDWTSQDSIEHGMSQRLSNARFTVLIDEDFQLHDEGLPVQIAGRQIELVTEDYHAKNPNSPESVTHARSDQNLPSKIVKAYRADGYLHVFIEP